MNRYQSVSQLHENAGDEAYFAQVNKNFKIYKNYIAKKNDALRMVNARKELQSTASPNSGQRK